jgi:ABC-type branched-subunit amino acid transport system ATPase component
MEELLAARGLGAGYGKVEVVRDVDISVGQGEVVSLMGPNGAGKTTTLLSLSGELPPQRGQVLFRGSAARIPLYRRARGGLAYLTEERSVFMRLTTAENLRVARGDTAFALRLFPELGERLNVKAGSLSGGEQQMLSLARCLARTPKMMLVDELSLGLAPLIVGRLLEAVREAATERGVGVLLVEQHVARALSVADRVYVMRRGRIAMSGTAQEFQGRLHEIEDSYLTERGRDD